VVIAALLAVTAQLVNVVNAGDVRPKTVVFEELRREAFASGETIRVAGPYLELLDDEVELFGSPARFVVRDAAVRRSILALSTEQRNLAFDAVRISPASDAPVFEVKAVNPAPDSATLLESEIEHLKAAGRENSLLLFDLGKRIIAVAERFGEPELRALARRACLEGIAIQEPALAAGDLAGRIELIDRALEALDDTALAVELLAKLEERFPDNQQVLERLRSLEARKFRGRWMTHEEFKRLQGFEKHGSVWVSPREKGFLESIFRLQTEAPDLIVRRRTDEEYKVLASRGEVAPGMTPEEVAEALGFPDRVYHRDVAGKGYDQWVYPDRYCYFEDRVLRRTAERK
jgi:hypothetical protein